MTETMTKREAKAITGGLTRTSKLGCLSWSISALSCKVGSKLRKVPDSVCSRCYALKGFYSLFHSTVYPAQERRRKAISDPLWMPAMVTLISGQDRFRWFDAGDIQDESHLAKIVQIARETPETRHWLPTREHDTVRKWTAKGGKVPHNLTIRLSSPMIGQGPVKTPKGVYASTVGHSKGYQCPARDQGNACLDCRACWNKRIRSINYHAH